MTFEIDHELLGVALELEPLIKTHSAEGEISRKVPAAGYLLNRAGQRV